MFGQHSITTTQTSANFDSLRNNKQPSDVKPFTLFPPSPAASTGRLFFPANDLPTNSSSLPSKTSNLESPAPLSTTIAPTTAPSVLIPSEGRITKGSLDNALPIFFAGAQQQQQQPSNDQEQEPSTQATELTPKNEALPTVESTNTEAASKDDAKESSGTNDNNTDDEIRTIKIFGFPPNMADTLRKHFERYGRIESSQHSPGNWLSILYASPSSAIAALKSNRMVIADSYMIGVTMATTNLKPIPSKSILARTPSHHKQQHHQDYKTVLPVSDGVFADRNKKQTTTAGTGQVGISVVGGAAVGSNRTTIPETTGWMGFFKDIFYG